MDTLPEHLKNKSRSEIEDWFIEALGQPEPPMDHLLAAITEVARSGDKSRAVSLGDLVRDKLVERSDRDRLVRLFHVMADCANETPALRKQVEQTLIAVSLDRASQGMVSSAGFQQRISLREVMRRLDVIQRLTPGLMVNEKTWGFGVVKSVDLAGGRAVVDFTGKPGHSMSLGYAGESLELIGNDHLMARKHLEPAAIQHLVEEDPAEIVRIALRSYGPMNVAALQERLTQNAFPGMVWKSFWDRARKALKEDSFVEIPSKRTEPIRLLERARAYDASWFTAFEAIRDARDIMNKIQALEGALDLATLLPEQRATLWGRFQFGMNGAMSQDATLLARLALLARKLGFTDRVAEGRFLERLMTVERFREALTGISARDTRAFIEMLAEYNAARTEEMLIGWVAQMPVQALAEMAEHFDRVGKRDVLIQRLRSLISDRMAGPVVFCWLCRNIASPWREAVISAPDLWVRVIECMGERGAGDVLRAQNQLQGMMEDHEWLQQGMAVLEDARRRELIGKILAVNGWSISNRRSVMAAMIKLYPELADAAADGGRSEPRKRAERWTSQRSYRDRVRQLKKLIEVEIPANSQDIGQARSYGDLRENAEYEAAKHQQSILLQRKGEMEVDLEEVKETDFAGLSTHQAGMGAMVTLAYPDGVERTFAILGEWDRDEALGIISSKSKLAEVLQGHAAGDDLIVPGVDGELKCRIVSVSGLTDEVRKWATGA